MKHSLNLNLHFFIKKTDVDKNFFNLKKVWKKLWEIVTYDGIFEYFFPLIWYLKMFPLKSTSVFRQTDVRFKYSATPVSTSVFFITDVGFSLWQPGLLRLNCEYLLTFFTKFWQNTFQAKQFENNRTRKTKGLEKTIGLCGIFWIAALATDQKCADCLLLCSCV